MSKWQPGLMLWETVPQLLNVLKVLKQLITDNGLAFSVNLDIVKGYANHQLPKLPKDTFITIAWLEVSRRKRNFSS